MNRALSATLLTLLLTSANVFAGVSKMLMEDLPDPGSTHLATSVVSIEMNLETGRPMIELLVNGEGPFRFVVDTGASLSLIDQGIAEDLGLEVVGEQELRSPGASEPVMGGRVQVGRLDASGLRVDRPVLATMDLVGFSAGSIEGVLGRPHFRDLLLSFDYPRSRLEVARGMLDRSDPSVQVFDADAGSLRFAMQVSGESVPMVLDTGSPGGFTLPKAMESRFEFRSDLRSGPTIQLVGGVHSTWMAELDGTVQLGDLHYEDPEVVLTSISDEFGNVGNKVLQELRVTVDQKNALIRFERRTAPQPSDREVVQKVARRAGPVAIGGTSGQPRMGVAFEMTMTGFVKRKGGLVVRRVDVGGPGDRAGLQVADIVISVGGEAVANVEGIPEVAKLMQGARPLVMELLRGDEQLVVTID